MAGNWPGRILSSTRGRILNLLRRGRNTVNDLAADLDLTDNAIRSHLAALEGDRLVQQVGVVPGVRKPHAAYALTPQGEQLFPKAYGPLLLHLLDVLSERLGDRETQQVLREVGRRAAADFPRRPGASAKEQARRSLHIIEELGGSAETETQGDRIIVRGFSCPLAAVVARHPHACLMAETLLSEVLGVPVKEVCEKSDPPRCRFEFRAQP